MRKLVKEFVGIVAEIVPLPEPVFEFGSLQVEGQEGFADLRPLFKGKEYVGCDMREGPGVDRLMNVHDIDLPDESVGTVLMLDTLEHVEFPHRAMDEARRILRPGGVAVISSTMSWRVHDYPNDYWRYTPEGFASMLRPLGEYFVGFAGDERYPHTVVGVGVKGSVALPQKLIRRCEAWSKLWYFPAGKSWLTAAVLLTPPVLVELRRRIRKAAR